MQFYFKLLFYFFVACFVLASSAYILLHQIMPDGRVFGIGYRMPNYHWLHPFQYVALISVIYTIVATMAVRTFPLISGWKLYLAIIVIMFLTVIIAFIPGGVLWSIHDMQAGFFPLGNLFWSKLQYDATLGLRFGWIIIVGSIPFNLIGLILGFIVTFYGFRMNSLTSSTKS
jgi:hypothetical protein